MFTKNDSLLASNFVNLSKSEQDQIIRVIKGRNQKQAKIAKEILISRLEPLIKSVVSSYKSYKQPDDVLMKKGESGVIKALETYDLSNKFRFSIYASWFIRADIHKFLGLPIDPENTNY